MKAPHNHQHAFTGFNARLHEGLVLHNRRNMIKAGLAGIAGLTLPDLLRLREQTAAAGRTVRGSRMR